jgi:hypothetical protein
MVVTVEIQKLNEHVIYVFLFLSVVTHLFTTSHGFSHVLDSVAFKLFLNVASNVKARDYYAFF